MNTSKYDVRSIRSRLAYPFLAAGMVVAALVGGLEQSSYLQRATETTAALVGASGSELDSAIAVAADDSSASSAADFNVGATHARVDDWVRRLTTSLRGDFSQSLTRMDKYAAMINAKLDAKQMPRELIYLALIESDFNPTARSKVGAVGMWQFMSATAKQFGLTVTKRKDERKDPVEATDAALTYLSSLHDRFGSWYLAAAAYNSGAGTVSKALAKVTGKRQGTDDDFFRIMLELPKETQDYVPKLIASARVGSDPAKSGI